ncbi:ABC transporter substrate-binding protein, partial [bacterium]|nr:ABC transporter substrate-binding protein [bacterium]
QCLSLKEAAADYAYLGNTAGSTISLLKSCETVGVKTQFMANIWGMDENGLKASGEAADGVVWVVAAATWNDKVPGMALVKEISKLSDPAGTEARPVHYMRGVCVAFYMKEAMDVAATMPGGVVGPNVKKAMYQKKDWVPVGLEGVCQPSTWTDKDHRGSTEVYVYKASVKGTDVAMTKVFDAAVPRRPEWLGK